MSTPPCHVQYWPLSTFSATASHHRVRMNVSKSVCISRSCVSDRTERIAFNIRVYSVCTVHRKNVRLCANICILVMSPWGPSCLMMTNMSFSARCTMFQCSGSAAAGQRGQCVKMEVQCLSHPPEGHGLDSMCPFEIKTAVRDFLYELSVGFSFSQW